MKKDETYHNAAITYNEEIAVLAEGLADRIGHPVVQKWCRAVAKQHRHHEKRHRAALVKLQKRLDAEELSRWEKLEDEATAVGAEKEQQNG